MHNVLIPRGGILTGSGVISLLWGFQADTGEGMSVSFSRLGYTGLDQMVLTDVGCTGLCMIVVGLAMLIYGNATAWKKTNGY